MIDNRFVLGKHVKVDGFYGVGYFGLGSRQLEIDNIYDWNNLIFIAEKFITPQDIDFLYEKVIKSKISFSEYKDYINILKKNNFLIQYSQNNKYSDDRYSRSFLHYESYGSIAYKIQDKLNSKHVVIIGCGGIGNHVSSILATSGIKKITLVDNDYIELSNLTRQILFKEDDVKKQKTSIVKRELLLRNKNIEIDEINIKITNVDSLKQLPKADIWVLSADEPSEIYLWVNEACVKNEQAYICAGYFNDIAAFGPLYIPHKTGCLACSNPLIYKKNEENSSVSLDSKKINNNFKIATFPTVNAISASFCAGDILKYLGEYDEPLSLNKRIGIWTDKLNIKTIDFIKSDECKVCGSK